MLIKNAPHFNPGRSALVVKDERLIAGIELGSILELDRYTGMPKKWLVFSGLAEAEQGRYVKVVRMKDLPEGEHDQRVYILYPDTFICIVHIEKP
jgi:hypothetical protein